MNGTYPVYLGGETVGKAEIERQGLYLRISCRCRFSGAVIYKLLLRCGSGEENLGVLVPEGDGFCLSTRIPVKRLGEGEPSFRAVPRHTGAAGRFVPVYPDEPFAYLTELKNAYLEIRGGQMGVRLPSEGNAISSSTGQ